jgi:hypothetical protein
MSTQTQITFSEHKVGRIVLHLMGIRNDHHIRWHIQGIVREFKVRR